jgi:hypothetical protein
MLGILTDPIDSNRRLDALGTNAIPATTGEALGATWDDALIRNPTASLFRWAGRTFFQPDGARVLSADDANREFGLDGALTFKGDTPEPYARDLYEMKRAELRRQDVQARAEGGLMQGAAQLGVGFIAGALDPLNIASAFLPVVGEARMASLLAGASGAAGRAGVRAAVGAAEGALGAALVEPIVYGVAQQEQADYHAVDSLLNLAFGAGLGGGLHVVGGAVSDRLGRWRNPVESRIEDAPFTAREAAFRSAVADVAEDRAPAQADLALRSFERASTLDAYDRVRANPRGPADDPLVSLLTDSEMPVKLRRGATQEKNGEITVPGRGDGLVKIILNDGEGSAQPPERRITRDDVASLPDILRDFQPLIEEQPDKDRYHRIWIVDHEDGRQIKVVASRFSADQQHYVVKMGVNGPDRRQAPSVRWDALPFGSPGDGSRVAGDTAPGSYDRPSEGRRARARSPMMSRGGPFRKPMPVFDADGRRIMVRYELAEGGDLVTSHNADLTVNPSFPAELQPRERDRVASHEQIRKIAGDLEPERLGVSMDAATGAPVVGGANVVESGNGRVLSVLRAYAEHPTNATRYRSHLADMGFDPQSYQNPILIRRRLTDLTAEERTRFTVAAQKSAVLDLSATERAIADARTIDRILPLHEGGDVGLARNAPFVRGFVDSLPQADQGGVLAGDGQLSRDGKRRVENALLARAFDDADLLGRMIETDDDNSRAIAGALLDVAPLWARMRADVAAGRIAPGVDATDDLLEAVRLIRDARASGKPLNHLLSQIDAFRRPSPATELFLDAMLRGKGTASRDAVASALTRYVDEAGKSSPDADLFGTAPPTREDLLRALKRHDPTAPPAEDLDVVAAVDRSLAQASTSSPTKPLDGPRLGDALTAANDAVDADLARLRDLGLIRGDEPEFQQAAALADDAASQQRALDAGAFCLSRRG